MNYVIDPRAVDGIIPFVERVSGGGKAVHAEVVRHSPPDGRTYWGIIIRMQHDWGWSERFEHWAEGVQCQVKASL